MNFNGDEPESLTPTPPQSLGIPQLAAVKHKNLSLFRGMQELQGIIDCFTKSDNNVRQQYRNDLLQSLVGLQKSKLKTNDVEPINPAILSAEISKARLVLKDRFNLLCKEFERNDSRTQLAAARWLMAKHNTNHPS